MSNRKNGEEETTTFKVLKYMTLISHFHLKKFLLYRGNPKENLFLMAYEIAIR